MSGGTVLVLGASGVVGRAVLETFAAAPGWRAIGASRRRPDPEIPGVGWQALDLGDAQACAEAAAGWKDVTHVVFAALHEKPGLVAGWRERDQMETNLAYLRNLLGPLQRHARDLAHVTLLQGTKAYGVHLHALKVPARERDPRDSHENFYWLQEDWLRREQQGKDWRFTILRPQIVIGYAIASPMNVLAAIGTYAALLKARGEKLHYPGGPPYVVEMADAALVGRAALWAATAPAAAGEIFNVANGDVLVWQNAWPAIARALEMEPGEARPLSLATAMPREAEAWNDIVRRHGLLPYALDRLVGDSFHYADFVFAHGRRTSAPPAIVSTVKIRQAGFADCVDSEDMFAAWFARLRAMRVLP